MGYNKFKIVAGLSPVFGEFDISAGLEALDAAFAAMFSATPNLDGELEDAGFLADREQYKVQVVAEAY